VSFTYVSQKNEDVSYLTEGPPLFQVCLVLAQAFPGRNLVTTSYGVCVHEIINTDKEGSTCLQTNATVLRETSWNVNPTFNFNQESRSELGSP
jgi:hypothetical protein